jgi:hypothetical protein
LMARAEYESVLLHCNIAATIRAVDHKACELATRIIPFHVANAS